MNKVNNEEVDIGPEWRKSVRDYSQTGSSPISGARFVRHVVYKRDLPAQAGCIDTVPVEQVVEQTVEEKDTMSEEELETMDDGLDLDMDFPELPTEEGGEPPVIEDTFKGAVDFSFVGVGHGGSRIAEAFYKLGYRRVCVVNTAKQDLDDIDLPTKRKLWLGAGGAAKNRRLGDNYARQNYENIMDTMRKAFGTKFDRVMVCCTAGGGTGSGGFEAVTEVANDLVESLRIKKVGDKTRVGLIIALPSNSERE